MSTTEARPVLEFDHHSPYASRNRPELLEKVREHPVFWSESHGGYWVACAHETVRDVLDFLNDDLKVDAMMISPAYAYEKAPDQEHFLGVEQTRKLFRDAFDGKRKKWRLNHSPMFLDFLEGKEEFSCTAWGVPSYSVLGWQRPCYLMADGYASSYRELVETTDWDAYGRGKDPRCANCMAHCGYEPSSVIATMGSLRESMRALVNTH